MEYDELDEARVREIVREEALNRDQVAELITYAFAHAFGGEDRPLDEWLAERGAAL